MLGSLARSLFGSANDRKVKPLWSTVSKINALEPQFQAMSDAELAAQLRTLLNLPGSTNAPPTNAPAPKP